LSSDKAFAPPAARGFGRHGGPELLHREGHRRLLVSVLVGLYFVLLAAPAVLLIRQHEIQSDLSVYLAREESWTLYRSKLEFEALQTMLASAAANDAAADRAAVQTAIDILFNRVDVLHGPLVEEGFETLTAYPAAMAALETALAQADAIMARETGPRVSAPGVAALRAAVATAEAPLNALIRDAMLDDAIDRDEIRARAADEMSWNGVATAALLAASLIYVGVLAWYVHELTRAGDGLRHMAAALQQSESRLRLIADNLPMLIAYVDTARRVLFINRTGVAWSGRPLEDIVGGTIARLFAADSYRAVGDSIARAIAGRVGQVEETLSFPDGTRRTVEASFIPDFAGSEARPADAEKVRGFFVAMIDVTARRESEEQLRQALKMEAVGRLTGGVAHDFNNLLGIIVGNLDLVGLDLADRPAERTLIDRAIGAAERGASLTQRLLAFSRKQTLLPRLTDVNRLVLDMSDMLVRMLGESIEVAPSLCREPCYVRIDTNQLESALLNLAVNARDAMPDGGRLTIATMTMAAEDAARFPELAPGNYVMISVSDTGTGMAPDVSARAFEPFFTTKEVGKGSGLGLSMVFGFVKQSGGHVEIESEPAYGTTVRLYLPRSAERVGDAVDADEPAATTSGKGRLVLVVEDNRDLLAFSVAALNRLGYRTAQAEDAAGALDILERLPEVSILFTDIMLPGGMDGVSLGREAQRRRPGIKLLFTSGFAQFDAQRGVPRELRPGVTLPRDAELISKPFRVSDLRRHLDRVISAEMV
jgi:PAS domain S-box-containing protein